jgi:hypothetical protein
MTIAPLYYPPANTTAQQFDHAHPGVVYPRIEKVVWHSTETADWPSYQGGAIAPHMTGKPNMVTKKIIWHAHFPANMNSRALRNTPGGVQTNTDGAFQIELVGTCDPHAHKMFPARLYMPAAPDWYLDELARFAAWAEQHWGVPLVTRPFRPYPASAGTANGVRFSGTAWDRFRGHCGHQHVPENVHGDPGSLAMVTVMDKAKRLLTPANPTLPKEDDMPLTKDDLAKIRAEIIDVLKTEKIVPNKATKTGPEGKPFSVVEAFANVETDQDNDRDTLKAILAAVTEPTAPPVA